MQECWGAPVRDFLHRGLVSVRPDTPLWSVRRTLEVQGLSAVPVVDEAGTLRGVLSSRELLRAARLGTPRAARAACDVMRGPEPTIDESAALGRAASEMLRHRLHRLVVLRDGRLAGILCTLDAISAIAIAEIKTPLSQVMTSEVETIDAATSVDDAAARLDEADIGSLVVVDGLQPIGVFAHAEAVRALAWPAAWRKIPVERVMSPETICFDASTSVDRVASYAGRVGARCILAVTDRRLSGIVTGFDLLRVMT
jgi:CBS domain-containing protein